MLLLNNKKIKVLNLFLLILVSNSFALQFGNGNDESTTEFVKVTDDVKKVFCGNNNTLIIKNDNSLWGTGADIAYLFGLKGPEQINSFVHLMDDVIDVYWSYDFDYYKLLYIIKNDNTLWEVDNNKQKLIDKDVVKFSEGLYIKKDKSLWAIGKDERGRFGLGTKKRSLYIPKQIANNISDVYSDSFYSFIIDTAGKLYLSGELNINSTYKNQFRFVEIDRNINQCENNLYVSKFNELYVIDYTGYYGLSGPTKIMDNIISAKAFNWICLALNDKNQLYGCGGVVPNYYGELGLGNKNPVEKITLIMEDVTDFSIGVCFIGVVKKDGSLWMCGSNDFPAQM